MNKDEDIRDVADVAARETEMAAAEAAKIGGDAPRDTADPARRPLIESGEGEAEGFELAERRLEDIASHGDQRSFPANDIPMPEEAETAERGEADSAHPADA